VRAAALIARDVRCGRRRATDVLEEALAAIEQHDPAVNAFVHVDERLARDAARAVDAAIAAGRVPGPLAGVPIGVKDLEDCRGMPTSLGSLLYQDGAPAAQDSLHVARLRRAGAVPVGKTATAEFGVGAVTSTPAWGVTRSPWDPSRTPGGSSGGSAAAVAAGMVAMATGSDSGGSLRSPAAFCGLVALKPTYGRIAAIGAEPSETACPGALVRTVGDAALHLDVAMGASPDDRLSLRGCQHRFEHLVQRLETRGLRAAWSGDLGFAVVDAETRDVARQASEALATAAELELTEPAIELENPIEVWRSETAADPWMYLEPGTWPAVASQLAPGTRCRLAQGERQTAAERAASRRRRHRLEQQVADLFQRIDVLLTPTVATTHVGADASPPWRVAGRDAPHGVEPFAPTANLCGLPAISVPAGVDRHGLPVGLQIVGRRFEDGVVLRLARVLELSRPSPGPPHR
jgi:aspartyl-tRNA(Asn)/glutamyl-tRNA(Gln) amidotransferase subunit A